MKTNNTLSFFEYGCKEWDVLWLYNKGKHRRVVVVHIVHGQNSMTVTHTSVSSNKYIRYVQIKYLKFKKYLYDKYINRSEQKNSVKQLGGDRSDYNNSL